MQPRNYSEAGVFAKPDFGYSDLCIKISGDDDVRCQFRPEAKTQIANVGTILLDRDTIRIWEMMSQACLNKKYQCRRFLVR